MSHLPDDWERSLPPAGSHVPLTSRSPVDLWLGGVLRDQDAPAEPLRFHLWELMVTITAAAVLLALFRALGIFGAALAFFAALIFTNVVYPRLNPAAPARQAAMFDFLWGALMPLVCLVFDPFVFKFGDIPLLHEGVPSPDFSGPSPELFRTATVYAWSWPVYAAIGWQIAALSVWLVAGKLPARFAALWAGMLWVGFAVASVVGIILILPATLAIPLFGIGVLGFTPLFTARAYYRRALLAGSVAFHWTQDDQRATYLAVGGFVLAILIPGLLGLLTAAVLGTSALRL